MLLNLLSLSWTLTTTVVTYIGIISTGAYLVYRKYRNNFNNAIKTVSVNYHFTRKCNKECSFCFHTEKTSYVAPESEMKHGLRLLSEAGMRKINFAGGEPFLYPSKLAMLSRFCKEELGLDSVSIITNGTKVTKKWMETHGRWVDIMGVSCDSFDEKTNIAIGRGTGENVAQLFRIRDWCRELGIKFKLNTVVCTHNWREDMAETVRQLGPFRWKVFQVLYVEGENDADDRDVGLSKRKRNAKKLLISKEMFDAFCDKHRHLACFVPEPNSLMASSYLILDEFLCFLDKGAGGVEKQSRSILEVGVQDALSEVYWDQEAFNARGGMYEWTKDVLGDNNGDNNGDEEAEARAGAEAGCMPTHKLKLLDW